MLLCQPTIPDADFDESFVTIYAGCMALLRYLQIRTVA